MRIEWLNKNSTDRVVVFFNGWGMDSNAVRHLTGDYDILMINDYRQLNTEVLPELTLYREVNIVAWSMGVWAAANILPEWGVSCTRLIALNGTEYPVNDSWGIPDKIYRLTERGMNAAGREKFMLRMLADAEERKRFAVDKPQRELEEVCDELTAIRLQSETRQNTLTWDKVYVSSGDVIFSQTNQRAWWDNRARKIVVLDGGHYPFYHFESWEEILEQ